MLLWVTSIKDRVKLCGHRLGERVRWMEEGSKLSVYFFRLAYVYRGKRPDTTRRFLNSTVLLADFSSRSWRIPSVTLYSLNCTVLYCTVLYCTVLYCTVLYCTVQYCTVLYRTVLYCTELYYTVVCCRVLFSTVTETNTSN